MYELSGNIIFQRIQCVCEPNARHLPNQSMLSRQQSYLARWPSSGVQLYDQHLQLEYANSVEIQQKKETNGRMYFIVILYLAFITL